MQPMQAMFNSRMEPVQTHAEYPPYARSHTKPVSRARHIVDGGTVSDRPCSNCVELGQDCYRWEGNFSKCAYCTAKDKNKEHCHLPGRVASPVPERRKRRKITGNIYAPVDADAASTADTVVSATAPVLVPSLRPSPPPTTDISPPRVAAPPPEANSDATLDRVTALETQVASLEAKVQGVLVQLDEARSGNGGARAAAGASSTSTAGTFDGLQARTVADASLATREWVEAGGPGTPMRSANVGDVNMMDGGEGKGPRAGAGHTVEHADGYRPVNCSCTDGMGP